MLLNCFVELSEFTFVSHTLRIAQMGGIILTYHLIIKSNQKKKEEERKSIYYSRQNKWNKHQIPSNQFNKLHYHTKIYSNQLWQLECRTRSNQLKHQDKWFSNQNVAFASSFHHFVHSFLPASIDYILIAFWSIWDGKKGSPI